MGWFFMLRILHSKKPWWQNQEQKNAVLFVPHMGRSRSPIITRSQHSSSLLIREEGCSVRAAIMVGERAGWRYLHEGFHCNPLYKESWIKHILEDLCLEHKPQTWGIFLYPNEYTVHHWIQGEATVLLTCKQVNVLCWGYTIKKDLHISAFLWEAHM